MEEIINYIPKEALKTDNELNKKVKKTMERISENVHISANEPSLAVYRLQEHVRRALPPTVSRRQNVLQLHGLLQGACYDVEYALTAVYGMKDAESKLTSIQDMLKDSIFYRQQLKYEQTRRKKEPSMYKRLSSHLTSMDLPDFHDFPDALRETASRVESALQHARSSYEQHGTGSSSLSKKTHMDKKTSKENPTASSHKTNINISATDKGMVSGSSPGTSNISAENFVEANVSTKLTNNIDDLVNNDSSSSSSMDLT